MKLGLFIFFLALAFSVNHVAAVGEVILDQILPVEDSAVNFLDPVFTNSGIITNINTESFETTRQFELNVQVPDVDLNALSGDVTFAGSLGAHVSSTFGDILFQSEIGLLSIGGSEINSISRRNHDILSQAGDITMVSAYPLELVGGAVSMGGESLSFSTIGAMSVSAGEDLSLVTDGVASFSSDGVFSFEARTGNVLLGAGNELVFSANGKLQMDGTHGVSMSTSGELSLIGGRSTNIHANTADTLARNNITMDFTQINFLGDDGVIFGGRIVDLDAGGRLIVEGAFPGSYVTFDFGVQLDVTASNDIVLRTTGETADVVIRAEEYDATVGTRFTVDTRANVEIGNNSTDSISINTSEYNFDSNFMVMRSEDSFTSQSRTSTTFESSDALVHASNVEVTATGSLVTFDSRDFSLLNRIGGIDETTSFNSADDFVATSTNLFLEAYRVNGDFSSTQTFDVEDLEVTSTPDHNVRFEASDSMNIDIEDDVDIETGSARFTSDDSLELNVVDYELFAEDIDMFFGSIDFDITNQVEFDSANNMFMEIDEMTWSASGEFEVNADTGSLDAQNLNFLADTDVTVDASKTIHLDMSGQTTITTDELEIDVRSSTHFKTSKFTMNAGNSFEISSDIRGRFGSLNVEGSNSIDFTADRDIDLYSGGDFKFISVGDQSTSVSDDVTVDIHETMRFEASTDLVFDIDSTVEFSGSEEFIFTSVDDFQITATNNINSNADIIEFSSLSSFTSVVAGGDITYRGGDILIDSSAAVAFNSLGDTSFSTNADTREIILNGRIFDISSAEEFSISTDEGTFSSADFTATASGSIQITGLDTSMDVGTFSAIASDNLFFTAGQALFETGYDRHFDANSAAGFNFFSGQDIQIDADSSVLFQALTSIDINSQNVLRFQSLDTTTIIADGVFSVNAVDSFEFSAAEDLSFETLELNTPPIELRSAVDQIAIKNGRDFHLVSTAPFNPNPCAIQISTTGGDEASITSTRGLNKVDSGETMEINSDGPFTVTSDGDTFLESYKSGLVFLSKELGLSIETDGPGNSYASNIEFLSAEAELRMFAFGGFNFQVGEDFRLSAERELNITALGQPRAGTVSAFDSLRFESDDASYFTGARGMTMLAGLDAPAIDSDLTVEVDGLFMESQDRFYARAIGTFTVTATDIQFLANEGNSISMSAAENFLMVAQKDIEFRTFDGDQTFIAHNADLVGTIADDIDIETTDGPISMRALAGGFTLLGSDWKTNSIMDTRALALGGIDLVVANDLRLISPTDTDCILIQNERGVDNVFFNANTIEADSNSGNLDYDINNIQINGQHVDFVVANTAGFLSNTGDVTIGGENSSPLVRVIAGGDDTTTAVSFISNNDIDVTSSSTISSQSTLATFTSQNANVRSSGFINMVAVQGDINFLSTADSISIASEVIANTAGGNHVITGSVFSFEQTENDIDGRLTVTATGDVALTAAATTFDAVATNDMDVLGTVTTSGDNIDFLNIVPDDVNFPDPFFSDIGNERGHIYFSSGGDLSATSDNFKVTVGRTNVGSVPLNNNPTFSVESTSFDLEAVALSTQILSLGGQFQLNSQTGTAITSTNAFTLQTTPEETAVPFTDHPSDISISSFQNSQFISQGTQATNVLNGDISIFSQASAAFTITNDFSVTATQNPITLIEFVSIESGLNILSGQDITISTTGIANPPFGDSEKNQLLFSAAGSLNIESTAQIDLTSTTNFDFSGAFVNFESDSTQVTSGEISFTTNDFGSDIELLAGNSFTLSSNRFDASSTGGTLIESGTQAYSFSQLTFSSTIGDIYTESPTTSFTSLTETSFIAGGHDADNQRAITISGDVGTFTATQDITIHSQDLIEFTAQGPTTISADTYLFQSLGFDSPITLTAFGSALEFQGGTGVIQGGTGVFFNSDMKLAITTNGAASFKTEFRETGIIFDTDIERNSLSSLAFTGTTGITISTIDASFETDFTVSETAQIRLNIDTLSLESTGTDMPFVAEEGNIIINAGNWVLNTVDLRLTSENFAFDFSTFSPTVMGDTYIESTQGSVYYDLGMQSATFAANDRLIFHTEGVGRNNDVSFTTNAPITIGVPTTPVNFHGNRGDAGILIKNDAVPSANWQTSASANTNYLSLSGISITGTRHVSPSKSAMNFDAGQDIVIEAFDKRGSVFFQSDNDLTVESLVNINHINYGARMGFFSRVPEFIHYVMMQDEETCLSTTPFGGWCGFTRPASRGNVNAGIRNLNTQAVAIEEILKNYGLINWKNPLV